MKHPGNYNAGGGGTAGPYLPTGEDSHQYTVMSYYSGPSYGGTEPITPQLYDVATIQYLYGVNSSTRSGNDTYTFATSLQIKTIWDGGGADTFDASNQTSAVTINLNPGAFSSISGTNNIAIAYGAFIEKAIGTGLNDTLRANDVGGELEGRAGNDTLVGGIAADKLTGGAGKDTLTGGGGADTFVFADGNSSATLGQRDLITDFTAGTDKLDLVGIDADSSVSGDQAFRFLGTAAFDGNAGALRYSYDSSRNVTVLEGDSNTDKAADFAIELSGNRTLTSSDFTTDSLRLAVPLTLTGTANADTLIGDILDDSLSGLGGNDTLKGLAGNDVLDGGTGADTLEGGDGDDTYVVDDAGDTVTEGSSAAAFTVPSGWTVKGTADFNGDGETDVLVSGASANQIWLLRDGAVLQTVSNLPTGSTNGWAGWTLQGLTDGDGDGDKDRLYVYTNGRQWALYLNGVTQTGGGDYVTVTPDAVEALTGKSAGTDTVQSSIGYTLGTSIEKLTLTGSGHISGTGNAADNVIAGNAGNNTLTGKAGTDTLTGNGGVDTFVFADGDSSAVSGKRDLITDFTAGTDKLDLVGIDANSSVSGDQAFRFLGTSAFDGQGAALRYGYDSGRGVTVLEGDLNGDKAADFAIELTGDKTLTDSDFTAGSLTTSGAPAADVADGLAALFDDHFFIA